MNLEAVLKQCKTDNGTLYRVNEPRTEILIVYIDDMLAIGYKPSFLDTIYYTKE